jgi:hypothetical protein
MEYRGQEPDQTFRTSGPEASLQAVGSGRTSFLPFPRPAVQPGGLPVGVAPAPQARSPLAPSGSSRSRRPHRARRPGSD